MKKKIYMLLMAMVLIFTACGGAETAEVTDAVADEAEDAVKETVAGEAEDAVKETEEAEDGFAKGILTADGCESEWLGIRYTAPVGTAMSSEEDLNAMMGLGQEILSEDFNDLQLKYAELTTVYEMMCASEDQVTNVMVTIEKLPVQMDIDTYITGFEHTLSQVTTMTYTVVDKEEVFTVADKDFARIECIADYNGVEICQDYCLAIVDDRAVSITVTYLDEVAAENILRGFGAY